jgi:transposase InsO family protein
MWRRRQHHTRHAGIQVFAASMKDIDKALRTKTYSDPRIKLPKHYHEFLQVFDRKEADKLAPHRGPQDHHIERIVSKETGQPAEPPFGPLYSMTREELFVVKKILTDYLDKGFIRVSNSPAAAPVLLVRKPGGGIRFCVDYRALNKITKKDRYPLPLIHETLERISRAKWFTKLDVIHAFHKIRIAEGDEWLTAFRTRFGLYEWLVTPFGLANAPSTFQRYINWALRDILDDFASAYLDDILVFTDGSLREHRKHVRMVFQRLQNAGLQLDIDKCEFETKSTKYLGFIVEAEKGVRMDPEKVKAITEWAAPTSVKAVRSFLGFANFYRQFIRNYSSIAAPLTELTRKDTGFRWTEAADKAFTNLKKLFTTAPILLQFDSDRETVVETDSSGWAVGGVLSQYDDNGLLRPCAYFSKKNAPAECNYEIHDKELLAIIRCLQQWESELTSLSHFTVITDHKNLRYFMTLRRLTERQMRWADILSRYNFSITYRPGEQNKRSDALSRKEQDLPQDASDERLQYREVQLLPTSEDPTTTPGVIHMAPMTTRSQERARIGAPIPHTPPDPTARIQNRPPEAPRAEPIVDDYIDGYISDDQDAPTEDPLEIALEHGTRQDDTYMQIKDAVRQGLPRFPKELGVKISISECQVNDTDQLTFRGRIWVPNYEPVRTRILQEAHDSTLTGHPGKNTLYGIVSQRFYWPSLSEDTRRFTRNCDLCRSSMIWRERRQGLLKPLPIPDRKWQEISMDFIVDLPLSDGCTNLLVITDRLGKGCILTPMATITTSATAETFLCYFVAYHGLPRAIVSDRGSQFVGRFWKRLCQLLRINRRLSTAFHPETDGSTERKNQDVELYIRIFANHAQDNWARLTPMAALALNNRESSATNVSPFFLDHGFNLEPWDLPQDLSPDYVGRSPIKQAEAVIAKLRDAEEHAKVAMAASQQLYEDTANQRRDPAHHYRVGDLVWLDLRNIKTDRISKKLDARSAKFKIIERIGSHAYRLDTPPGIHNVFHTMLLRPAATDPFPSQKTTENRPGPVIIGDDEEYEVEAITNERWHRTQGRQYQVKWTGWSRRTWEREDALEDATALDVWRRHHTPIKPRDTAGRGE